MSNHIDKMKKLIRFLPKNDDLLGLKFINTRDFQSLLELVVSDIYLVSVEQDKEEPKEKYKNINLDSLLELQAEIKDYMTYLELPEDINYDYEEIF